MNIVVCAPARTGSTFIGILVRKITTITRWDTDDSKQDDAVLGPIRSSIPSVDEWNYIVHLRHPLDHIVSLYHSLTWDHPYMGPLNREFQYEQLRLHLREMTIDEFCFWYYRDYIKTIDEFIDIGRKQNATFLTYEDMWDNYHHWVTDFLEPFKIFETRRQEIIKHQKEHQHKSVDSFEENKPKLRHGIPGEHKAVLKQSTIDMLRYEFRHIINFMDTIGSGKYEY
jgi:hypothetical protein